MIERGFCLNRDASGAWTSVGTADSVSAKDRTPRLRIAVQCAKCRWTGKRILARLRNPCPRCLEHSVSRIAAT